MDRSYQPSRPIVWRLIEADPVELFSRWLTVEPWRVGNRVRGSRLILSRRAPRPLNRGDLFILPMWTISVPHDAGSFDFDHGRNPFWFSNEPSVRGRRAPYNAEFIQHGGSLFVGMTHSVSQGNGIHMTYGNIERDYEVAPLGPTDVFSMTELNTPTGWPTQAQVRAQQAILCPGEVLYVAADYGQEIPPPPSPAPPHPVHPHPASSPFIQQRPVQAPPAEVIEISSDEDEQPPWLEHHHDFDEGIVPPSPYPSPRPYVEMVGVRIEFERAVGPGPDGASPVRRSRIVVHRRDVHRDRSLSPLGPSSYMGYSDPLFFHPRSRRRHPNRSFTQSAIYPDVADEGDEDEEEAPDFLL